jgi:hypothetical protein
MKSKILFTIFTAAVATLMFILPAGAEDMGGWEKDGEYDQHYRNSERDRIKGEIVDVVEITPLEGMSPGVALEVRDQYDDKVLVHLAPKWYVDEHPMNLRKGDEVKIKGVWATIGEKDVFMAAKVKRSEYDEYKVRLTSSGMPFWAMPPEQLAKELAQSE